MFTAYKDMVPNMEILRGRNRCCKIQHQMSAKYVLGPKITACIIICPQCTHKYVKLYVMDINRLASLSGRPNTSEKQPYITLKSNPSKIQKHLLDLLNI